MRSTIRDKKRPLLPSTASAYIVTPEIASAAERYFTFWTAQRDALRKINKAPGALVGALSSVAPAEEAPAIAVMSDEEIRNIPPVKVTLTVSNLSTSPPNDPENVFVEIIGDTTIYRVTNLCDDADVLSAVKTFCEYQYNTDETRATLFKQIRVFTRVFWEWYENRIKRPEDDPEYRHPSLDLPEIAQQTFAEAKTLKRSLALTKSKEFGKYWTLVEHELQMRFSEGGMYGVQIEGNLLPPWLNGPKDIHSLREEVCSLRSPVKIINVAIARLVTSEETFLDIDLDDFMDDIGINPRSTEERLAARMEIFRALMIISAARVIGTRSNKIFDKATKKWVDISCGEPLMNVTPWHETGRQFSFEPGVAPLRVRLYAMPFLQQYRGNYQALQYFGNVLNVSKLPTGKPSNAVAVSIADALNQLWREQATKAKYRWVTRTDEVGTKEKIYRTALFEPFTRKEILEMFPPEISITSKISIMSMLDGDKPDRAVEYIESAIRTLMEEPTQTIGHYSGYDGTELIDWSQKARKARGLTREKWKAEYLNEKLDVRPTPERIEELWEIKQGKPKRRGPGKPKAPNK